jgi:hypothetical protein
MDTYQIVFLTEGGFEFISSKETLLDGGARQGHCQYKCANSWCSLV